MRSAWIKYLPIVFGIILFTGCNSDTGTATDTTEVNPILKEDPALKGFTEEIAKTPKDAALFFARGHALQKMKLDSLALKDYQKAVSLDSTKAEYYSAVGDLLFENKDLTGSIKWIQKAITLKPDDRKAHLKIAKLFLYLQDYPQAFSEINIVLRKNVYDPEAYFLKAMIYKDSHDTAKAISNFLTAVQVAPDYRDAVIQLGILYSAKKDSIALRYLENAYVMDTSDVFPVYARGTYFQEMGDMERAKAEYRRCIIRDRHYTDAYFNTGYILMQQDSVAKAWRQYDICLKSDPTNPAAYYNRGLCSEMMDSVGKAVADYKTAYKLDGTFEKPKNALKRLGVKM
jgi:tetratricopeptide (TPR) repeat protein